MKPCPKLPVMQCRGFCVHCDSCACACSCSPQALKERLDESTMKYKLHTLAYGINKLVEECHSRNVEAGWWTDLETGQPKDRNDGELLMLMVSELAEAMEGIRKNLMDDKLPHRKMVEVELADTVIRIADYCGARKLDLGGAIIEKMEFNRTRDDHKIENRRHEHGKKI